MVSRLFFFLHREIKGVHNAAYLLAIFAFLSQILALIRDRLLAHYFGAAKTLDIYYASFRIPDLIFFSVASLVSISVLIPFLSGKIDNPDPHVREESKHFMDEIFTSFFGLMIAVSLIAFFVMPYLVHLILPALKDQESINQYVNLSRILLLQPIALGISNLLGSITQVTHRFYIYAVSPLLYNAGIIFGIIFLYPRYGLYGVTFGVVIGAILHMAIQLPYISSLHFFPHFVLKPRLENIKKVVMISLPRTLTLSFNSLELIFITSFASYMNPGSISIFNFSLNLQSVPFAIIGVSYSLAAFPTLSKLYVSGDKEEFLKHIIVAARHIVFWSLPVMALFIVLRAQIVRVILGSGNFNWDDTRLTAACLALFVASLVAQSLELLFIRGYYAGSNTKKPLIINLISSFFTIAFPFILIQIFNHSLFFRYFIESLFKVNNIAGSVVLMLPLGYSLGTIINMIVLWVTFSKDFDTSFKEIFKSFSQSFAVSILMGFFAYIFLNIFGSFLNLNTLPGIFLQGFLSGLLAIIAGIGLFYLLKNEEILEISKILPQKMFRSRIIVIERENQNE